MKAYLKTDITQFGEIISVYCTLEGQKRMTVRFPHSLVDADVATFEVVEN